MSEKITDEHARRGAMVYIRQSSPTQVNENRESQRRQYGLAERARELGFQTVNIIDDDLGRSGSGLVDRRVKSERCLVSRRRDLRATVGTGITSLTFAVSLAHS
jgi:hypothetical protein